ncbi:MAG: SOS-response transcriptional repressor, LexA [Actinomycetia bacterium]|nr:SOS-response transcriptional repressor, LexA [Actinomycetes bacterium]
MDIAGATFFNFLTPSGSWYQLSASGRAAVEADGDSVVVRRECDVHNGDIVAALLESDTSADREATVKTLKRVGGHVWLIPHNPAYSPILADSAIIVGRVVTVLRCL